MTRAERRAHQERIKKRVSKLPFASTDPRALGKLVSTHGRPCSCHLCHDKGRREWRDRRAPDA